MAQYYYSNHTDPSEYNQNYDFVHQDYEPSFYNIFDYNPKPYYNHYNNIHINYMQPITTTAYSTFTPTEPKSVQYVYYHEPTSHHIVTVTDRAFYSQTTAAARTSTEDFNSSDFDEYDPTPYGGGYDIVQTYGRPLPPSDQTCYSLSGGSTTSKAPSPPPPQPQPVVPPPPQAVPPPPPEEEEEEVVSQIPSGYGLEAMDLLGNFFSYWPSYYYYAGRGNDNDNENGCRFGDGCAGIGCGRYHDSGAADYLFGTLDPYVERRDGGGSFGQPIHCYDEHLREQALSIVHVDHHHHDYHQFYDCHHQYNYQEDDDNSWSII